MKELEKVYGKFVTAIPRLEYGRLSGDFHVNYLPDSRMAFAQDIIAKWALVAAEPDGEDSSGRAKLKLKGPGEIAAFACEVAEKAFAEFEARGWMQPMPNVDQLFEMATNNKKSEGNY